MTPTPPRKNEGGFTYIAVLMVVVIMGIMAGMAGTNWKLVMKREREQELLFRGSQYIKAIAAYRDRGGAAGAGAGKGRVTNLKQLDHLLKDPRSLELKRYLRKSLFLDPVTGKEWEKLEDPNLGIYGVRSTSKEEPLKQAGFPEELKELNGKKKYSEWEFAVRP